MDPDAARRDLVSYLDPDIEFDSTAAALLAVPRHEFVPDAWRDAAYADQPIPIGNGQTVSAPHMVAAMVDHLALSPGETVLEVGTGCGYHAAVFAEVVGPSHVFSVEYDADLAASARERLDRLGYGEVSIRVGDGREGWPEHAPYDKAYVTCATPEFPPAVVEQVRPGGLLLAPLGRAASDQRLVLAKKRDDGTLDRLDCGAVQFVSMRGADG